MKRSEQSERGVAWVALAAADVRFSASVTMDHWAGRIRTACSTDPIARLHEGFSSLDPSHPLGGKDGGQELTRAERRQEAICGESNKVELYHLDRITTVLDQSA